MCLPTGRQNAQKLPSPQGVPSQYQAEAKQRHVDLPWLSCWYVMFDPVTSCHRFYVCVCVCLFLSGLSTSHRSSRINRDKVQKDAEGPNTCHPHSHSHLACKVLRLSISCGLSSVSGSHGTNLQAAGCHRLRS